MKTILSTSEIIGFVAHDENEAEIWATANAHFGEEKSQIDVELRSFVRPANAPPPQNPICPRWLPKRQTVVEHVPRSEAVEAAREIFHRWVGRVRQSVPMPIYN